MVFYRGGIGAAAVFGRGRGWEMPFYIGCATDEGDVVEVDYLPSSASRHHCKIVRAYSKDKLEFRLQDMSVCDWQGPRCMVGVMRGQK